MKCQGASSTPFPFRNDTRQEPKTFLLPCAVQAAFRKEVQETFLRCVDMGYDQDLAVIELNGLKIAEARDFADNACYIMTTILALCLPAAPRVREEYRSLFPDTAPDSKTPVGNLETASIPALQAWHALNMCASSSYRTSVARPWSF